MGERESSPNREIHSITGLVSCSEETRKSSNKQFNFTLKGTWKGTINQAWSDEKEGNNKDQSRNKWNNSLKKQYKRLIKWGVGSLKRQTRLTNF